MLLSQTSRPRMPKGDDDDDDDDDDQDKKLMHYANFHPQVNKTK